MTVAERAVARALGDRGDRVFVTGPPGAGKSAAARAIAVHAAEVGKTALLLAPPSGAADSGAATVLQALRRLGERSSVRGWDEARRRVARLLRDRADEVVVVCDEPSGWSTSEGHFARRAAEAADLFAGPQAVWPVVVCDRSAVGTSAMGLPDAPSSLLRDRERWQSLGAGAAELADSGRAGDLRTPLQQRLGAALLAWGVDAFPRSPEPHDLALILAEFLSSRRHGRTLWAVWQRIALERLEVGAEVLARAGGEQLDELSQATLDVVLLDGGGRLHDVLRRIPEERAVDPEISAQQKAGTHRELFDYHFAEFARLADVDSVAASDHAGEALHHAGELGDATWQDLVGVDLADQLNALGRRRATVHHDLAGAAAIFGRALEADPADAYAAHGRAFALDSLGQNEREVADLYAQALAREPTQPSWHAHRIAFLVDSADLSTARSGWAQAEAAVPDDRDNVNWYGLLHLPVSACLIGQGELAFASYVLEGVPDWARTARFEELRGALEGRMAAQDAGTFVPAPRSGRAWWMEGPARLPARDTDGRVLQAWMAGCIEAVDGEAIQIHVARVEPERVRPGLLELSRSTWEARFLDAIAPVDPLPGRFVEIGRYEGPDGLGVTAIVMLPEEALPASDLLLDPERWLRGERGTTVG